MPTIRERIGYAVLGNKIQDDIRATVKHLTEAYLEGPYLLPPDQLMAQLSEYVDSGLLWDLVSNAQFDVIAGLGDFDMSSESSRLRAVDESRRMNKLDVVTQWAVQLWTDFGFGENVTVTPADTNAQDQVDASGDVTEKGVWSEFWEADRNSPILADDEIQNNSETVLVDGEFFWVYFVSRMDGEVTVRIIDTKQITEIVTDPEDDKSKWWYKRQWNKKDGSSQTLYYPDWRLVVDGRVGGEMEDKDVLAALPDGAKRADKANDQTLVVIQHVSHNRKGGLRGWPLSTTAAPWTRAHKKFRESRSAVAEAVAMYINKVKVQGGSRAVDAVRAKVQSAISQSQAYETNPPAAAGSTWVENQAANLERLPLGTGAGDAKADGEALLLMAGLGVGLYPHWLGAGDAYRLATATSMEGPMYRQFSRYQKFWGAQFRKMVRIVLWAAATYGKPAVKIATFEADVSTDRLVDMDLKVISDSLTGLVREALMPAIQAKLMDGGTASKILSRIWLAALQALGVDDANKIITEDAMSGTGEETPPIDTGGLTEAVDEETGKFIPRGYPLPAFGDGDVEITAEDVEQAIRQWDNQMPADLYGLLRATPVVEEKDGKQE